MEAAATATAAAAALMAVTEASTDAAPASAKKEEEEEDEDEDLLQKTKDKVDELCEKLPPQLHMLSNMVSRIPAPAMTVVGVVVALLASTSGCHFFKRFLTKVTSKVVNVLGFLFSKGQAGVSVGTRFVRGQDAIFATAYATSAVSVAVAMFMATFLASVPVSAIVGVLLSILGVWASVAIEFVCSSMDDDDYRAAEQSTAGALRRRLFFHGMMGLAVAAGVMLIAYVGAKSVDK